MTTEFTQQKNAKTNAPIYLYTLFDYDGFGNDLNYAEWDSNITFDSIEYTAFPITHNEIGENSQGEIDSIKINISNVSRLIQYYLETYNFKGKKVRIRLVWLDRIDYPTDKLDFIYYIDSYTANESLVEFSLTPKTDVLQVVLPARMYSRNYCQWQFRSTECGYSIANEETCNRTKQRCKELQNYSRFGGFPSIPMRTVIIK